MTAIISLVIIALFSFVAVRVATTALTMTGLSYDAASFQSYSAFFGVGFTTREAELVVNHPVRRRIIRDLILVGNIGLTSALATMVASLMQSSDTFHPLILIGAIGIGVVTLSYIGRIGLVQRTLDRWIQKSLSRAGLVRALDYELLLRVEHGYCVSEKLVEPNNPIVGLKLSQSRPWDHGVVFLAIRRENAIMPGIPGRETTLMVGDVVTLYGHDQSIKKLMGHSESQDSGNG